MQDEGGIHPSLSALILHPSSFRPAIPRVPGIGVPCAGGRGIVVDFQTIDHCHNAGD